MKKLKGIGRGLHLADKFLLVIMFILMIQMGHNLLFHEVANQDHSPLDAVIRTTTASIFGYFISSNFLAAGKRTNKFEGQANPQAKQTGELRQTEQARHTNQTEQICMEEKEDRVNRIRISVIAIIGICSLLLLLIVRNYAEITPVSLATVAQLRDFVSGSIGFLIGQPVSRQSDGE